MNKKQKKAIDKMLGYFLSLSLRVPAFILERLLKRNHTMPLSVAPRCIVVAKYIGIGSILQSTQMVKGLKDRYPNAELIYLSVSSNKGLLSSYGFIDKVMFVEDSNLLKVILSSLGVIRKLIFKRVDIFLDLEVHSTYGSLMCLMSCAKNRLGFSLEDEDHRKFLYTHMLFMNLRFPIRYCYNQLGRIAGIEGDSHMNLCPLPPEFNVEIEDALGRKVKEVFDFDHKGIIVLNSNASDLRYERRWAGSNFAVVASHYAAQGYAVALAGSLEEKEYVNGIISEIVNDYGRVKNIAGVFSLLEFIAFLKDINLLVTNDSGIMNMALTMDVPQLLLAGPVDPSQYFVPGPHRVFIYYQTYCSPCTHYIDIPPCGGNNICMQQIKTDEVISICDSLLRGESVQSEKKIYYSINAEVLGVLKDKGEK